MMKREIVKIESKYAGVLRMVDGIEQMVPSSRCADYPDGRNPTIVTLSCGHVQELPWGQAAEMYQPLKKGGPWSGQFIECEECK